MSDENSIKRRLIKKGQKKEGTKFRAQVDKNTSLTMFQREGGLFLIIKKDLTDYEINVTTSEAPIMNQYLKSPDPFESLIGDAKIIEKEIEPLNVAVQNTFGQAKEISLTSVRLAIGSNENDFITIDETDLKELDVEPTMQGLLNFVSSNRESIVGVCDRSFEPDKGNIIMLDAKLRDPSPGISSIEFRLLSSLQQRGMAMQKFMKYAILQRYVIIKAESINDIMLNFLREMDIDWETIFLRRELSMDSWLEIECERNQVNLKAFLNTKYEGLGFFDVNNIARIAINNQLSFKVVDRMADLLNQLKLQRIELTGGSIDSETIKKAEIYAAAKVSCAYFGVRKEIALEEDTSPIEVAMFEAELVKL
jgi:hypothetical protein